MRRQRNTLADGDNTFIYDDRNRLVEAVDPATQLGVGDYGHNALGQRVVKITAAGTVLFAYDEAGHLLGEYDAAGNAIRQYVWLGDRPVAMLQPNGTAIDVYYIHADHLNTPKVVTDQIQAVVWKADYEPFGKTNKSITTVEMNLRFPGQYEDQETGLNYNYFRSYSSATGRYTQSDPIGLSGGMNTYGYALGSPAVYADPSGLNAIPWASPNPWVIPDVPAVPVWALPACAALAAATYSSPVGAGSDVVPRNCTKETSFFCDDGNGCEELYRQINQLVGILKKRYSDMRADRRDLFNARPSGSMSWAGHQQQFRQVQQTLRGVLNEADSMGCKNYRADAWNWATMPAPSQPAP